ncbi:MAG: NAD(P)H-hydrate dehydratase [Candidatus Rokubacteria bacterium]|nr:NAD(P)H-hydrate dehydratase [Candidatus Rokubacteria bacterium]
MRAVDRRAITELGISGSVLMEHAGRGAAQVMLRTWPALPRARRPVVIVCGKGGNAGDGFVVARHLKRHGVRVAVLLTAPAAEIHGDAGHKLGEMRRARIRPVLVEDDTAAREAFRHAELVVDALLGTGTRGAPTGLVARMIEAINASGRPVVALDVPSGLPALGDGPAGPVVRATLTTTFAGVKRGLVMGPAGAAAGRIEVVPIGIPPAEVSRGITTFLLEPDDVARHFPPRRREAHKGDFGRLLIVAGSVGKTGAAALAARAAMRSGAGLVTVAAPASQQPVVAALLLEAMTEPVPETGGKTIAASALAVLQDLARARDAVAIGPGIGLNEETASVARALAGHLAKPLVIDADGLTALAGHIHLVRKAPAARCLTPHPGEMARLLGRSTADVQRDRLQAARDCAERADAHVVLKGATSVIAHPDGRTVLNPTGNPGMASGGTGDVLTGMVGAFLARGLPADAALECAVYLHGRAGDLAAEGVGHEALIASDVIEALPSAFAGLSAPRTTGTEARLARSVPPSSVRVPRA